jgi:hypothetical protein
MSTVGSQACARASSSSSSSTEQWNTSVVLTSFTAAAPTTAQFAVKTESYWTGIMLTFYGTYDFVYVRFSDNSTFYVFSGNSTVNTTGAAFLPINSTGITAWAYAGSGADVPTTYVTSSSSFSKPKVVTGIATHAVQTTYTLYNDSLLNYITCSGWVTQIAGFNIYLTDRTGTTAVTASFDMTPKGLSKIVAYLGAAPSYVAFVLSGTTSKVCYSNGTFDSVFQNRISNYTITTPQSLASSSTPLCVVTISFFNVVF